MIFKKKHLHLVLLLVSDTQLYKSFCPLVHPLVRQGQLRKLKSGKTSVLATFYVFSRGGYGWGSGAAAHPSETIL